MFGSSAIMNQSAISIRGYDEDSVPMMQSLSSFPTPLGERIALLNAPCQYTLAIDPVNAPFQSFLSKHPLKTPFQNTL